MRDYAKVGPQFWHGKTGKALKKKGSEAVIVALYLMTCPHSNMLGLYFLSRTYIAVDTGLGLEGASKGLQGACEAGFCGYDDPSEVVWVYEMAVYQIAEHLEARDNRCKGVQREYDGLPENPFLWPFFQRYGEAFHMTAGRGEPPKKQSPSKAPRKPLRSQEQEQEQEQKQDQDQEQDQDDSATASQPPRSKAVKAAAPTSETWDGYAAAYQKRYHVKPVRNATVNGQLAQLVARLGAEEAPQVAAFFVAHNNQLYRNAQHPVTLLLRDAESLRTQWATGRLAVPAGRAGAMSDAEREAANAQSTAEAAAKLFGRKGEVIDA